MNINSQHSAVAVQALFAQHLLLRMPVKSPADYSADAQSFLEDCLFLSAIYLATPSFYESIKRHGFQNNKLSKKEANTLQKYINRYCFRPTPFGLFASVSLAEWSDKAPSRNFKQHFQACVHADMTYQNALGSNLLENELYTQATYEGNPSIYRVMNEYRFFRERMDEACRRREYLLQSIAFSKLLKDLLAYCCAGRSRQEIVLHITAAANCTTDEGEEYADFLIDAQLLLNCLRVNITGTDYLKRLANTNAQKQTARTEALDSFVQQRSVNTLMNPESIVQLHNSLNAMLPPRANCNKFDYLNVILQRPATGRHLGLRYQQQLRDGINALELLSPNEESPAMAQFINAFQQHFEGQTIPLLMALDPEAGIGYQRPAPEKNNPLLETMNIHYKIKSEPSGGWTDRHSLLMEAWLRDNVPGLTVIRLTESDLRQLKQQGDQKQLLGISILFRVLGEKVFIENAGGINAPALMGRFTVADPAIRNAAQQMARHLEAQNPDIIFAELLHLADPHTDNINRRESIYRYELPITAASVLTQNQQLQLSDLYISIEAGRVMLHSEKHKKIVIPRLTSAYNHSLNKLPLFRFLADLPYQYGRSDLGFNLRQLFPNLHFYPRVEYANIILSLATWILPEGQLSGLQALPEQAVDSFKQLARSINLPALFSLADGDQELVFDWRRETEILFFCSSIRERKEVVLKEFL